METYNEKVNTFIHSMRNIRRNAIGRVVVDIFDDGHCDVEFARYQRTALYGHMGQSVTLSQVGKVVEEKGVEMLAEARRESEDER